MRKNIKLMLLTLFVSLLFTITKAKADFFNPFARTRSWDFMQEAGGIKVGQPLKIKNDTIFLPIKCDVSGLRTITQKPTMMNSALGVYKVEVKIEKNQILISVVTCIISERYNPACKGIYLKKIPSGKYDVFYYYANQKNLIGSVIIP
jgi:hypothetical protein